MEAHLSPPELALTILSDDYAVCALDPASEFPTWALAGDFISLTRTPDELSIVCPQRHVPEGVQCERGWRALKVQGPLDFSLTGVLASLLLPLAQARIPVFAISTYETDYLLVREEDLAPSIAVFTDRGHRFDEMGSS